MTGHGFEVTGDPADLPPGTKIIPMNITETVEKVAQALYGVIQEGTAAADVPWEALHSMERHNMCELALAAVHALAADGWHPASAHDAIQAAMAEDDRPETGMDPR